MCNLSENFSKILIYVVYVMNAMQCIQERAL